MTFTLLVRIDGEGEDPVYVRSYGTHQAAMLAKERAEAYLTSSEAPKPPGDAPEGFAQSDGGGTLYRAVLDMTSPWLTETESRLNYPFAWALYDARADAFHWWQQANPIDRGAPPGSLYVLYAVEHVN